MKTISLRVSTVIFLLLFIGCSKPVIEGQVVDDLGVPVEGVVIKIMNSSLSSKTDSEGKYSVTFVPGEIKLMFTKSGYVSDSLSLNITEKTKYPAENIILYKIPSITLLKPINSPETVMGKWFTIEGQTDRAAIVVFNGNKISLDQNNSFSVRVSLRFGKNQFKINAKPINHSESTSLTVSIIRELFPAEKEFLKASDHITIHSNRVDNFAIDDNDNYLVTVYGHDNPHVYDLKNNKLLKVLPKPKKALGYKQTVGFTPDGKYLLVGGYYSSFLDIINISNWATTQSVWARVSDDDIITCKEKNIILISNSFIFNSNNFKDAEYIPYSMGVGNIAISNDCNYILSSYKNKIIIFRTEELEKGLKKFSDLKISILSMSDLMFSNSGDDVIVGTEKGKILIYKLENVKSLSEIKSTSLDSRINSFALTQDDKLLIVGTDNRIYIFDYPSLNYKLSFNVSSNKIILTKDGKYFYYISGSKRSNSRILKAPLKGINWSLIEEYNKLKEENII